MEENHTSLKEIFSGLAVLSIALKEICKPYIELLQEFQKYYYEHKDEINSAISEILNNLQEVNNFLGKTIWDKLKKYGWILPGSLPISVFGNLYKEIKTNLENKDEQEIFDNFFVTEFTANNWYYIDYLIKSWNSNKNISKERLRILKDCFKIVKRYSHKTSANVVIPTLMAQVEGILIERFNNKFKIPKKDNYAEVAKYLVCTQLFAQTTQNDTNLIKHPEFSRNKVLHGEYVNYGDIKNVIKLYLLIEILLNI